MELPIKPRPPKRPNFGRVLEQFIIEQLRENSRQLRRLEVERTRLSAKLARIRGRTNK
jgi:hypothetical protein